MLRHQRSITNGENDHDRDLDHVNDQDHEQGDQEDEPIRDIHALTPPPAPVNRGRRRESWETGSHRSSSMSMFSEAGVSSNENFTSMSREFSALVLAGSSIETNETTDVVNNNTHLARIGEDEMPEDTNPLAIVPDHNPLDSGHGSRGLGSGLSSGGGGGGQGEVSVQRVKKEEVEAKISAWQNAKIAKVNNRFKREEAVINGWESEQVQKATSWMKKIERKLEEKRARALEKMQNKVAKARRKAEERRASSEAKRGTKVAKILEVANLMKAVGRAPVKRSFF